MSALVDPVNGANGEIPGDASPLAPIPSTVPAEIAWDEYKLKLQALADDDSRWRCQVCMQDDSVAENLILICDGCSVCVHQFCSGVLEVPEGEFLCQVCSRGMAEDPPRCLFCPNVGGVMMPCTAGKYAKTDEWCHCSCALWLENALVADPNKWEGVTGVIPGRAGAEGEVSPHEALVWAESQQNKSWRARRVCPVCHGSGGILFPCSASTCDSWFHVSCAQRSSFRFKLLTYGKKGNTSYSFQIFCEAHTKGTTPTVVTLSEAAEATTFNLEQQRLSWALQQDMEDKVWDSKILDVTRPFPGSWRSSPHWGTLVRLAEGLFLRREEMTMGVKQELRFMMFSHDIQIFHNAYSCPTFQGLVEELCGLSLSEDSGEVDLYRMYRAVRLHARKINPYSPSYVDLLSPECRKTWAAIATSSVTPPPELEDDGCLSDIKYFRLLAIYRRMIYPFERFFDAVGGWRSFISPLFRLFVVNQPGLTHDWLFGGLSRPPAGSQPAGSVLPHSSGKLRIRCRYTPGEAVPATLLGLHGMPGSGLVMMHLWQNLRETNPLLDAEPGLVHSSAVGTALYEATEVAFSQPSDPAGAHLVIVHNERAQQLVHLALDRPDVPTEPVIVPRKRQRESSALAPAWAGATREEQAWTAQRLQRVLGAQPAEQRASGDGGVADAPSWDDVIESADDPTPKRTKQAEDTPEGAAVHFEGGAVVGEHVLVAFDSAPDASDVADAMARVRNATKA
jgi:hypothetical protein